jgi:hypothetical protein
VSLEQMRVALKHYEAWVSCTREFPMHIRTFFKAANILRWQTPHFDPLREVAA